MPRRGGVRKRDVLPDFVYNSKIVTKLINQVMLDGKKAIAEGIVYGSFDIIKEKLSVEPDKYFLEALENLKPLLETKARRVGGSNYQVPVEVSQERRVSLGLRWLVNFSRTRSEKSMEERLCNEIIDANNGNAKR